jgi:prevent-host-death family protein
MKIKTTQQVSATYARNNFKEVTDKVLEEGMCVIVRKSKPIMVMVSMSQYDLIEEKIEAFRNRNEKNSKKKITLEELRKNSTFGKYAGCFEKEFGNMTSVELQHKWAEYVD